MSDAPAAETSFTQDWFSTRLPLWEAYLSGFRDRPNLRFLEIGCFEGRATIWLLENALTADSSCITVIDTFEGGTEHTTEMMEGVYQRFMKNVAPWHDQGKVAVKVGLSGPVLRTMDPTEESFDLIYVDGSHEAPDVLEDTVLSWRLLKQGGLMIFDDYLWGLGLPVPNRPKAAIDAFLVIFADQYELLAYNNQLSINQVIIRRK